jgi:two-component system NarL family response regulator
MDMNTRLMIAAKKTITSEGLVGQIIATSDLTLTCWITEQAEFQEKYLTHQPDCILLGYRFFEAETTTKVDSFTTQNKDANILVLYSQLNKQLITDLMDSGAKGIISPGIADFNQLNEAIRCVAKGRTYLCQYAMEILLGGLFRRELAPDSDHEISQREKQIIRLIAEGNSSKEIAKQLEISPSTVDVHRKNIMRKIGAHKVAEITRYAVKKQIVAA